MDTRQQVYTGINIAAYVVLVVDEKIDYHKSRYH